MSNEEWTATLHEWLTIAWFLNSPVVAISPNGACKFIIKRKINIGND